MSNFKRVERERKIAFIAPNTDESSKANNRDGGYGEYMALLSLFFGLASLLLRHPWFAWQGIFCCIVGLANQNVQNMDYKQVLYSISVSMMGLFVTYRNFA